MQGWRLGWAVVPQPLARHLTHLIVSMVFGTPPFTQDAALFALTHELAEGGDDGAGVPDTAQSRLRVAERLSRSLLSMAARRDVHDGRCTRHRSLDNDFAWGLLDTEGVSVLPTATFGDSAAGYVRFSLTAPEAVLEEACNRIERYARSLIKPGEPEPYGGKSLTATCDRAAGLEPVRRRARTTGVRRDYSPIIRSISRASGLSGSPGARLMSK